MTDNVISLEDARARRKAAEPPPPEPVTAVAIVPAAPPPPANDAPPALTLRLHYGAKDLRRYEFVEFERDLPPELKRALARDIELVARDLRRQAREVDPAGDDMIACAELFASGAAVVWTADTVSGALQNAFHGACLDHAAQMSPVLEGQP